MRAGAAQAGRQGGGYLWQRHHDHRRDYRGKQNIMALHKDFPKSPYAILNPEVRWFPADEALRESSSEKLMPPLVPQLRKKVKEWRGRGVWGGGGRAAQWSDL